MSFFVHHIWCEWNCAACLPIVQYTLQARVQEFQCNILSNFTYSSLFSSRVILPISVEEVSAISVYFNVCKCLCVLARFAQRLCYLIFFFFFSSVSSEAVSVKLLFFGLFCVFTFLMPTCSNTFFIYPHTSSLHRKIQLKRISYLRQTIESTQYFTVLTLCVCVHLSCLVITSIAVCLSIQACIVNESPETASMTSRLPPTSFFLCLYIFGKLKQSNLLLLETYD